MSSLEFAGGIHHARILGTGNKLVEPVEDHLMGQTQVIGLALRAGAFRGGEPGQFLEAFSAW